MRSLRVDHQARNRDEWPNLSELNDARPRFPDGEPVSPLRLDPQPVSRTRIILALVFIISALFVRACMPGYLDEGNAPVVLSD